MWPGQHFTAWAGVCLSGVCPRASGVDKFFLEYTFAELGKVRILVDFHSQFQRRSEATETFCDFRVPGS